MAFAGGVPAALAELEMRLAALEAFAAMTAPFNKVHIVTGAPAPALGRDGDLAWDFGDVATSTGLLYAKSGGAWSSTGFQAWKA